MSPIQNKDFKTLKTIQFEELQEQTESNQTIHKKPVLRKESQILNNFQNKMKMKFIHNKLSSKMIALYN